ncbi:MAG: hypothetical protein H7Y17_03935 [Chlorobia bacterium]|nr:hypothetical protein [Fimbriimonadaceae bacterium]
MLKRLNALSTPSGAPLFSKDTSFFVEAVANVSLGKGEATFVVRERARSNGHIADRKIPSKSPIYARPDLKNSICINASQDSTDAAHWKRLASTWVVLLERRKQIEEDLTDLERKLISHFKLGIAGADRLWPSKQIQQLPESVASQIQQQSFRKGWSIEQTKGAKVASVKSTLLVVFTFGKNEIAFPLRSLFDR